MDTFPAPVTGLRVTGDGRAMLVSTLDSSIRLMDRGSGGLLRAFKGQGYRNEEVRLKAMLGAREEMVLVGSEADGRVRGWEVVTGEEVAGIEVIAKDWADPGGRRRIGDKERPGVVSVVEWKGDSGLGTVWAAAGVDGKVRVYGNNPG